MISLGENCKHSGLIPLKSLGVLPFISMGVLPRPYNGCSHLSAGVDVVPSASQTPGNRVTPAPVQQARKCPCSAEPKTTCRDLPQLQRACGQVPSVARGCGPSTTRLQGAGDINWGHQRVLAGTTPDLLHPQRLGPEPCTEIGPPIWQQGPKQRGN